MKFWRTLLVILVVAAAFRFVGLEWDQRHAFHPDERRIAFALEELSLRPLQLNPHFFSYGSFPIYLEKLWTSAAGALHPDYRGFHGTIVSARALSALIGVLMVAWLALLGRRLYDDRTGLLAAVLLALAVLPIQHAHFITVDLHQAFFALVVIERLVRFLETRRTPTFLAAAAVTGLALATKVSNAPLLLPLALAPLLGGAGAGFAGRLALGAGGIVMAAIFFALGEPYALLDFEAFAKDIREQSHMVRNVGAVPYTIQYMGTTPWIDDLRQAFTWGTGPVLGLAVAVGSLAAAVAAVRARSAPAILPWLFAVPYFAIMGWLPVKFLRYLLPLYPLWCLWAARLLSPLPRRPLATVVVAATALWAISFTSIYLRPHVWVEASSWFHQTVPAGAVVLRPHWDEGFPVPVRDLPNRRYEMVEIPLYEHDSPEKMRMLAERFARGEWLVLQSKRLYGAISNAPERFPRTLPLLEHLFAGHLGYRLEQVFTSRPRIFGIEWNDDFADESFTVYDHPKTLVFRRVSEISAPELLERIAAPRPGVSREDMIGASIGEPTEAALPGETGGSLAALARWLALLVLLTFAGSRLAATTLPDLPPSVAAGLGPVTGVLTLSWAVWLAVAAGGAPFGPALAMTGVTLLVLVSLCLPGRPERLGKSALVFLGTFALFALARSIHPEIFWGEKPMDFSFLNALYRTTTLPPPEPWMSGKSINYSYFGHFTVALLGRSSGVTPAIAFNLGIATVAALVATTSFAIGRLLSGTSRGGLAAAAFVTLLGNLAGPVEILRRGTADFTSLVPRPVALNFDYFWATSRVIEGTINEFPLWSFLFADIHAHVLALPWSLLVIAVACSWFLGHRAVPAGVLALGSLALGAVAVTSTWSLPVGAGVLAGLGIAGALAAREPARLFLPPLVLAGAIAAFTPYWLGYVPPPSLWGLNESLAPVGRVLEIFGLFLLIGVAALISPRSGIPRAIRWAAIPVLTGAAFVSARTLALSFALLAVGGAVTGNSLRARLVPLLAAGGALLVATADTLVLWDRMNTVFKLYLDAWLLLALAASAWILDPRASRMHRVILALPLAGALLTAVTDAVALLRTHRVPAPIPTLDGQAWLDESDPEEAAAIRWLNREVRGTPTLLEAEGPPYRDFSRISMHTGLPTVVGWEYHLFQRAHTWDEIRRRQADVDQLYRSTDREIVTRLLARYRVDLVFVGEVERREIPAASLRKFSEWSDLFEEVFRAGRTGVFRARTGTLGVPDTAAVRSLAPRRGSPDPDGPLPLREPRGITADNEGALWVTDFGNDRIQRLTPDDEPLAEWRAGFYGPRTNPGGAAGASESTAKWKASSKTGPNGIQRADRRPTL